ncbi:MULTISPECIES: winged helix-turn-helix transcriptional regulator [unclassified Mesorhizobium]|nr:MULTISPECIES: winged helix-turn-helix transcriptional regulator [unclassified Mesorhizobium]
MIDDLDRRILGALQKNNRLSFSELADFVGSSAASCMRRVNKLRAEGVITADISLVDPKALGKSLTVVVTVELDRERLARISHTVDVHRGSESRKMLLRQRLTLSRGIPRCKQSVYRNGLILHLLKGAPS